jgi:hypothetical protein
MKLKRTLLLGAAMMLCHGAALARPVPVWDNVINSPGRFKVLAKFGGAAVLDKETGLVWTKDASTLGPSIFFDFAVDACRFLIAGNRGGWRLPSFTELMTLIDMTNVPTLPTGHPFTVVSDYYWTTTSIPSTATVGWVINPSTTAATTVLRSASATPARVWCVRGGHGEDVP